MKLPISKAEASKLIQACETTAKLAAQLRATTKDSALKDHLSGAERSMTKQAKKLASLILPNCS